MSDQRAEVVASVDDPRIVFGQLLLQFVQFDDFPVELLPQGACQRGLPEAMEPTVAIPFTKAVP